MFMHVRHTVVGTSVAALALLTYRSLEERRLQFLVNVGKEALTPKPRASLSQSRSKECDPPRDTCYALSIIRRCQSGNIA